MAHYLSNGTIIADKYQTTFKYKNQTAVQDAILNQQPNNVLQHQPPTDDPVKKLSRAHRVTQALLRSGHCKALNTSQN